MKLIITLLILCNAFISYAQQTTIEKKQPLAHQWTEAVSLLKSLPGQPTQNWMCEM
jgi:hypothetical protein